MKKILIVLIILNFVLGCRTKNNEDKKVFDLKPYVWAIGDCYKIRPIYGILKLRQ